MTTVFIAGSIAISRLHEKVKQRIERVLEQDFQVVVGDADGADASIQDYLRQKNASKVVVYCSGTDARNNLAHWPVEYVQSGAPTGTRAFFTAKDKEMAKVADFGLMIWDTKSTGTLSNVIELLNNEKKSVVFVNKNKEFVDVRDVSDLERLLSFMSGHARAKAEEKIKLSSQMAGMHKKRQLSLAI
jgi:hypothetical protein